MDHISPKEMGMSHEEVMKQVRKIPLAAVFVRTFLFVIVLMFCMQYVYRSVAGAMPEDALQWDWIGVAASLVAVIEASVADYIKKFGFYETENASIAYGFFLFGSLFTAASVHFHLWPPIALVLALATMVAAGNVIRRRFDFFDLD